jgi:hypothetical protein
MNTLDCFQRFWSEEATLLDVLRTQQALREQKDTTGELLHPGLHYNSYAWQWQEDGLLGQRFFGPEEGVGCLCGYLSTPEQERQRCPQCETLCLSSEKRGEYWAFVKTSAGFLHPAVVPELARLLSCSEPEIWAVARFEAYIEQGVVYVAPPEVQKNVEGYEWYSWLEPWVDRTGPGHLRTRLKELSLDDWPEEYLEKGWRPEHLIVDFVPVLPVSRRPTILSISGHEQACEWTLGYRDWMELNTHLKAMFEHEMPAFFLAEQYRRTHRQWETLWSLLSLQDTPKPLNEPYAPTEALVTAPEGAPSEETIREFDSWCENSPEPSVPEALHLLSSKEIALVYPYCVARFDLEQACITQWHPKPWFLKYLHGQGERLLFDCWGTTLYRLHLQNEEWEAGERPEMSHAAGGEAMETALLSLADLSDTIRLREVIDYPQFHCFSADGRYCWSEDKEGSGGIYDTSNGQLQYSPAWFQESWLNTEDEGEPVALLRDGNRTSFEYDWKASAAVGLCLSKEQNWHLFSHQAVVCDEKTIGFLGVGWSASCWEEGGEILWVADVEEIQRIQVLPELKVLQRWSLQRLHSWLKLPDITGIGDALRRRLLLRFGNVERFVDAGPEGWLEVHGVGKKTVERLKTALSIRQEPALVPELPVVESESRSCQDAERV